MINLRSLLTLMSVVFSLQAQATTYSFAEKIAGPDAIPCLKSVEIQLSSSELRLSGKTEQGYIASTTLQNINGGRVCSKLNSSYIFGGWRCREATSEQMADGGTLFVERGCTQEFTSLFKCNPSKQEDPSNVIEVRADGSLLVKSLVNWADAPYSICRYTL